MHECQYKRLSKLFKEKRHDIDTRPLPGSFVTFSVDWKNLIIALMVEMGIFTALVIFLKPLH